MSTAPVPTAALTAMTPLTAAEAINKVSAGAMQYAPLALSTIVGIENAASGVDGATKSQIAVNVILAAAHTGEAIPNPTVQAVSMLVDLIVSILNKSGLFSHKPKPAAVTSTVAPLTHAGA